MEMDIRRPAVTKPHQTAVVSEAVSAPESPANIVPLPPPEEKPKRKNPLNFIKHHWLTLAFVMGFVVDNLTLNSVDQFFDNALLAAYVVLAMVSMLMLYAGAADKLPENVGVYARRFAPFVMQYAFGGLLSGMLIFYGRAGAWTASWPYLAIILLAIYGNETIKDRSTRLMYNLAILFIGLFSYVVLIVPVVTGLMGPWIFVGSGLLALVCMYGFIRLLYLVIPRFLTLQIKAIVFVLGSVFACFNFLYFTNLIPPIPLSLKDAGIYHFVARFENNSYQVKYEEGPWWRPLKEYSATIHPTAGGSIYCFAQVFAPTKVSTDIVHVWEYKDAKTGKWVKHASLPYAISGGRGDGYRGYTQISGYHDGLWRCSVETARGQVLGRETFTIDTTAPPKNIATEIR